MVLIFAKMKIGVSIWQQSILTAPLHAKRVIFPMDRDILLPLREK